MYAGHMGVALAATRRVDLPLSWLLVASIVPDLLPAPLFHTAPAVALVAAGAYGAGRARWSARGGEVLAALVVLHFAFDLLTSSLLLWPDGPSFGLRVYDRPLADFGLEGAIVAFGWWQWRRSVPEQQQSRSLSMLLLLLGIQTFFSAFLSGTANG